MSLTVAEKWAAINQYKTDYDGAFFYAVKTTGIFCRPSCKSKPPLWKNTLFFDSVEAACSHGFRPCKRCRPDLLKYQPALHLAEQIKAIYDNYYTDPVQLAPQVKQLPVSPSHLIRMFKEGYGLTPVEYVNRLRTEKAGQALVESDESLNEIAMNCGFGSLSSFYAWFKKRYELSPNEFRRHRRLFTTKI